MRKSVLILGATGRFGRHAAEAFWNAGWSIHAFDRKSDDLMRAAQVSDVIVAAWNPAYSDWAAQVLPLHRQIIAAAQASGSTVIVPSNVYVYAPDAALPWGPDTAHDACSSLGRIRQEMEALYRESGVQTIFLRSGDYIDTEVTDSWLDRVILKPLHKGYISYPGRLDAAHSWAWLPDLARAAVQLAEVRIDLDPVEDVTFEGYTLTGAELAQALSAAIGKQIRARVMPWWPLLLAQTVWPHAKHLNEMRYLWDTPHRLSGDKLRRLCPQYLDSPLSEALRQVVRIASEIQQRPAATPPLPGSSLRLS